MLNFPGLSALNVDDGPEVLDLIKALFHFTKGNGRLGKVCRHPPTRGFQTRVVLQSFPNGKPEGWKGLVLPILHRVGLKAVLVEHWMTADGLRLGHVRD